MKTVFVFDFEKMEFVQSSEEEGKEWCELIENLNQNCIDAHNKELGQNESNSG